MWLTFDLWGNTVKVFAPSLIPFSWSQFNIVFLCFWQPVNLHTQQTAKALHLVFGKDSLF